MSGASHPPEKPGHPTGPQMPGAGGKPPKTARDIGRTHKMLTFLVLGLAVLAFGVSYALGLIALPE